MNHQIKDKHGNLLEGVYFGINGSTKYIVMFKEGESKEFLRIRGSNEIYQFGKHSIFWQEWGTYEKAHKYYKDALESSIKCNCLAIPEGPFPNSFISEEEEFNLPLIF